MQTSEKESKNWLEWTVFAVGCVLVLGAIGCLAYEIWQGGSRKPPVLNVRLGKAERRGEHYAIPVAVLNTGDETAEAVRIQVVLETSDGQKEQSQFQIQFVPQQATRSGYAIFDTDPATATKITARPLGFQQP